MKKTALLLLLLMSIVNPALATPAQVLIIRHAEKINDQNPHLSETGQKRAQALIGFFINNPEVNSFGPPVVIFAAAPKDESKSVRPYETVAPLANYLHQKVNLDFQKDDIKSLIALIRQSPDYEGKTVLISWVNSEIPKLARKFGAAGVPADWDNGAFDRVWKITFSKDGKAGTLVDLPQRVLPGDSEQ